MVDGKLLTCSWPRVTCRHRSNCIKVSNKEWASFTLQFDTMNNHLTAEELAIGMKSWPEQETMIVFDLGNRFKKGL